MEREIWRGREREREGERRIECLYLCGHGGTPEDLVGGTRARCEKSSESELPARQPAMRLQDEESNGQHRRRDVIRVVF